MAVAVVQRTSETLIPDTLRVSTPSLPMRSPIPSAISSAVTAPRSPPKLDTHPLRTYTSPILPSSTSVMSHRPLAHSRRIKATRVPETVSCRRDFLASTTPRPLPCVYLRLTATALRPGLHTPLQSFGAILAAQGMGHECPILPRVPRQTRAVSVDPASNPS